MDADVVLALKKAMLIKVKLEALDRSNASNQDQTQTIKAKKVKNKQKGIPLLGATPATPKQLEHKK
jgi:hypothetical protein